MTSVGELRLSRKPDFKGANEKRERWQTQAGITCQNRERAETRASEGEEYKGLGFKTEAECPQTLVNEAPECSSPLTDCTEQHPNTGPHLLKPAGPCLCCIIKKTVAIRWRVAMPWTVF